MFYLGDSKGTLGELSGTSRKDTLASRGSVNSSSNYGNGSTFESPAAFNMNSTQSDLLEEDELNNSEFGTGIERPFGGSFSAFTGNSNRSHANLDDSEFQDSEFGRPPSVPAGSHHVAGGANPGWSAWTTDSSIVNKNAVGPDGRSGRKGSTN